MSVGSLKRAIRLCLASRELQQDYVKTVIQRLVEQPTCDQRKQRFCRCADDLRSALRIVQPSEHTVLLRPAERTDVVHDECATLGGVQFERRSRAFQRDGLVEIRFQEVQNGLCTNRWTFQQDVVKSTRRG